MKHITVALLLGILIIALISGCVSKAECTADSSIVRVNIEGKSIKECTDKCHFYGIDWRTQIYGQSADKEKILCTCYQCRTI